MRPFFALTLLVTVQARAQTPVDPALAAYIASIKAIDNHAHPMAVVPPGGAPDTDYDALPLGGIPDFPLPWRLTLEAPVWGQAAHALAGVTTPAQALDRFGIQLEFANRIAMGAGLDSGRFRWVPFDDPLIFPLDTRLAGQTPDTRALYPLEAKLIRRYLGDLGLSALPPTLAEFRRQVVVPILQRQHDSGAPAIKFEVAYLRSFDFATPDTARAAAIYAQYAVGGAPSADEVKVLSDALFRDVAREAGKLGMAVHLHALEFFGGYYQAEGARPGLLEGVFNDSTLRHTNFILIHGGWPHVGETEAMLAKPNVYADISMMDLILAPEELATVLRGWLMRWPDKVLFGTDAFDGGPKQTWEMGAWVASTTARRALGMALTAMVRDGDITMPQARTLARKVLRDNAIALYHLK
ncbi:MAG TPA: hypothetical protein VJS20_11160 [Gemmatimonadales bacterium]|nr:hypothetical protein [Gemmatimonadales bacterium]